MQSEDFVHLHTHSDYSLLMSTATVKGIVGRVTDLGMSHVAVTDNGNMFGAISFYQAARKASKPVTPIIGCDFYVAPTSRHDKSARDQRNRSERLVLLAENETGYRNLMKLASVAYTEGFYYRPRIDHEVLEQYHDGLICLTGSLSGTVPSLILRNRQDDARALAGWYRDLFGADRFYLEVHDHGIPEQRALIRTMRELGDALGVGLVATNDTYYIRKEDADAHDTLLCIGGQKKKQEANRFRFSTDEFYLKSGAQMREVFDELPEAITNTRTIAERCGLELSLPGPQLPEYAVPREFDGPEGYLRHLARKGLDARYGSEATLHEERLKYELDIITGMGFTGYYLIVWDFIRHAKDHGIPVGPGRGSGAGSIVAYCLEITDIDPIQYALLFERFLNPDRVSMPDFDIDFCYERRAEVIDYVTEKYGDDRVGQIITFSTLSAKSVVRDVARVFDLAFDEADRIAKFVPDDAKTKLTEAVESVEELKEIRARGGVYANILDTAAKLQGLRRHASTHAAGVVIGKSALTDYVPLYRDPKSGLISTQFTMDQLEDCGLVKMDFLGLKTLTLITNTERLLAKRRVSIDWDHLPEDDEPTFRMLGEGRSLCVFQFESPGMQRVLVRAKPSSINDLIALNALYRPGPMENIDQFVDSKSGRQPIRYPHPSLEEVLKETYGVIIYQEQVMEIVRIIAGFSLGQADILRRAMGKKKPDELAKMRVDYMAGAAAGGIDEETATAIFELLMPFAGYGFNKSHAAAYSVLAYKTAYLKANYPAEFMAANLTNEAANTTKLREYIDEARAVGLTVRPPDINRSERSFEVVDGEIIFGMIAIKGVGSGAADEVVRVRGEDGPYAGVEDFLARIDMRTLNRKTVETLVEAGAFDQLEPNRNRILHNLEGLIRRAVSDRESRKFGQSSLFGDDSPVESYTWEDAPEWSLDERLNRERDLLGTFLSGTPLDSLGDRWIRSITLKAADVTRAPRERRFTLVGYLDGVRRIPGRSGVPFGAATLNDYTGSVDIVAWDEAYARYGSLMVDGAVVGVVGQVEIRKERYQIVVEQLLEPDGLPEYDVGYVHVKLADGEWTDAQLLDLRSALAHDGGQCPLFIHIGENGSERVIRAADQLRVSSKSSALGRMSASSLIDSAWVEL